MIRSYSVGTLLGSLKPEIFWDFVKDLRQLTRHKGFSRGFRRSLPSSLEAEGKAEGLTERGKIGSPGGRKWGRTRVAELRQTRCAKGRKSPGWGLRCLVCTRGLEASLRWLRVLSGTVAGGRPEARDPR